MNTQPIRVGIIDDHRLFRKAISLVMESVKNFSVVLEAENGLDFIKKMESAKEEDIPDICLLDVNMPEMDGYETQQYIKQHFPDLKVLALSMYDSHYSAVRMVQYGANGYLSKKCTPSELRKAIISIHYTGQYKPDEIKENNDQVDTQFFSEGEIRFVGLCSTELSYAEIAKKMGLTLKTIEGYRDELFKKLSVRTRGGLVAKALNSGILLKI